MNEWWTAQEAGLIGGLGGGVGIGGLGALFGVCMGVFASKGKLRALNLAIAVLLAVIGIGSLVVGIAAVISSQPYHVWYPLVLVGFLGSFFGIGGFFMARFVYAQAEQRRIDAEQLRRS